MNKFDKYNEIDTSFTDVNGVTFVDGHTPRSQEGKVLGYIVNFEFYPTDPDIIADKRMMGIIYELINGLS